MEDYAGRILAERYRLPLPPSDEYELIETRAFDTRSGQEVLVRQVPLPEVVDAELLDGTRGAASGAGRPAAELPAVRRAIAAAQAAASVPDHPRLDQVFDVFAEGGSLWIVSELVPARPLAALIADEPLSPYRAAEVASDVLTALRVLHAHGWTHGNITVRTVLICDDGRVVLTGLAAGAAEEALCGYDPVPPQQFDDPGEPEPEPAPLGWERAPAPTPAPVYAPLVTPGYDTGPTGPRYADHIVPEPAESPAEPSAGPAELPPPRQPATDRAEAEATARARTVAAYRAGTRAATAKVAQERGPVVVPQLPPTGANLPQEYAFPYGGPDTAAGTPWHGAAPRRPSEPQPEPEPEPEPDAQQDPHGDPDPQGQPDQHREPQPDPDPHAQQGPHGDPAPEPDPHPGPPYPHARPRPEPAPSAPARPVLPAQLALPQGYHQADPPPHTPPPAPALPQARAQAPAPAPPRAPAPPDGRSTAGGTTDRRTIDAWTADRPTADRRPADAWGSDGWSVGSGPRTGLDAERARQTRMAVVGAVTERWAPEQAAGPVHGHWQLAPPVGPATDLWALGALLYRAVQGHAPYPEDSVAELVEMVCAEPPAFAEECGPLRPVVESLLRQDPTERPDFEELRGWLRSLVRSAPEPDGDFAALPLPEPDPARLPVVRRRGDLHGRHRNPAAPRKPRSLGRTLLVGVLAVLAAAVAYAVLFMPRAADTRDQGQQPTAAESPSGPTAAAPKPPDRTTAPPPSGTPQSKPAPQTDVPGPAPEGYTLERDPEHFTIAVPKGWDRRGINEAGQVRYTQGQFTLVVVPGRDRVEGNPDPKGYQQDKEPELSPWRNSTWAESGDVKSTTVAGQLRVTGRYTWIDSTGRSVLARNFVVALGGTYHVVMVTGPKDETDKVTDVFEKATASYKAGG
ncbi:serine/threonine protein kinase [Streptomyces sp. NBC_00249]|uniref:serine/threonine protein kinase n=1 Tax=Streptomyces sp. NBC_00249 TaxID=2975690 RepID=UPI002251C721|nr:serine/threonine protein kinase [Streptomyces sp. NBC_00249]MCX5194916.1 serine/threonine protein kinase [Streptomyces sp. NBC_00249]